MVRVEADMIWKLINTLIAAGAAAVAGYNVYLRQRERTPRLEMNMRVTLPPIGEEKVLNEEVTENGKRRREIDQILTFTLANPTLNNITLEGGRVEVRLPSDDGMRKAIFIGGRSAVDFDRKPPVKLEPREAWRLQVPRSHLVYELENVGFNQNKPGYEHAMVGARIVDSMGNEHREEFKLDLNDPHYRIDGRE